MVPDSRIRNINTAPVNSRGQYVLYWMVATRRPVFNYALEHAAEQAKAMNLPLVVFEGLRCDYPWASLRLHQFVIDGMESNARHFSAHPVTYFPYVEPRKGEARGLLSALATQAALVVTDAYPTFFIPQMVAKAGEVLSVRLQEVDSLGLLPLSDTEAEKTTAHSFRRLMQKKIRPHLDAFPSRDPLAGSALPKLSALPGDITARWPATDLSTIDAATLPIDQSVSVVTDKPGGHDAAQRQWKAFLDNRLSRYDEDRNRLDTNGATGLSPYLHFGHISVHQLFQDLSSREEWNPARLPEKASGSRAGWWGMQPATEAFIDELITWREVGHHFCHHRPDHAEYESLPNWAKITLAEHANDPRPHLYTLDQFEQSQTHDPLWNAAQRELVETGTIHNYLRMLWGKKILEWSPTPQQALHIMITLNNKYALDGRDPNSYSGIFWVLGRFDRAWGPQRPIFGKIRYMSSDSTRRKLKTASYVARWTAGKRVGS